MIKKAEVKASPVKSVGYVARHSRDHTNEKVFKVKEGIQCVEFSPNGRFLAAGCRDNYIYVYDVNKDFKLVGVAKGHSSFIQHLTWSKDSSVLLSDDGEWCKMIFLDHRDDMHAPILEYVSQ